MTISSQQALRAQWDSYRLQAEQYGQMARWRLQEEPLDIPTAHGAYLFARRAFHFADQAFIVGRYIREE